MKLAVSVILGTGEVLDSTALGGTSSVYCTWTSGHRVAHQPQRRGNKQTVEKGKKKKKRRGKKRWPVFRAGLSVLGGVGFQGVERRDLNLRYQI